MSLRFGSEVGAARITSLLMNPWCVRNLKESCFAFHTATAHAGAAGGWKPPFLVRRLTMSFFDFQYNRENKDVLLLGVLRFPTCHTTGARRSADPVA